MSFLSDLIRYFSFAFLVGAAIVFVRFVYTEAKERWNASRTKLPVTDDVQPSVSADELQAGPKGETVGQAWHRIVEDGDPRHPVCRRLGHDWDDPEWKLYAVPANEAAWFVGHRPEYRQDQRCTREGCGAYRLRLREEGKKPRVIFTCNNGRSAESEEEGESHVSPA